MAIVLLIKSEDGQTAELTIIGKVTLGRSSSSDYKISDTKMSGQHCTFFIDKGGQLMFEDLNSTNGSYINNSRIYNTVVKLNDVLRIGNTLIKIDEKKLTPKERQTIGFTIKKIKREKTIPILTDKHVLKESPNAPKARKKPTIVLNKDRLKKNPPTDNNWMGTGNENVIEQEESSGFTKLLKLEKIEKKKKT